MRVNILLIVYIFLSQIDASLHKLSLWHIFIIIVILINISFFIFNKSAIFILIVKY